MEQLWPNTVVEENNLSVIISSCNKASLPSINFVWDTFRIANILRSFLAAAVTAVAELCGARFLR